MKSDKKIPLNEYITLQRGFDLPNRDRVVGSVPVVASTGVAGYHNEAKVSAPGVVIGRSGSIGGGQYVQEDFWPLNTTLWVKDFKGHDPRYVYYLLKSIDFSSFNAGAAVPTLNRNHLSNIKVNDLDEIEEKCVSEVLGALDDKIELNRQINQNLEQIAQAIFKSWFVDFEPVKAKIEAKQTLTPALSQREREDILDRAAMCAISGKTDAELDQLSSEQRQQLVATAALFPNEMVESELGLIPKGWEVKPLPEVMEVNPPCKLKKGTIAPYLDMANVPTNSARVANVVLRTFSFGSKFMNGDTLLARITPCLENGKTAFVDFLADKELGWGSTEFIVFRPKAPLPEAFGYLLCRHPVFRIFAIANMSGTSGRQRVPNDCFLNYKIVVPNSNIASFFGETVKAIMTAIKARDEEAHSLASIRDALLPKLFSSEINLRGEGN